MIVSASRRTDLPALFPEWLVENVGRSEIEVRNPFNPKQIRRVKLVPPPDGEMEALVLWTRNPEKLLPALPDWEASGIGTLFQVTITGYPKALEPASPHWERVSDAVEKLSALIGPERIIWRYDPVFTSRELGMDAEFHRRNFSLLADRLAPLVGSARISVYDAYRSAQRRLRAAGIAFTPESALDAVSAAASEAAERGLALSSCCEDLKNLGIPPGGCIDGTLLKKLWNIDTGGKTDSSQRKGCLCAPSVDIGVYSTCSHGCLYCYATRTGVAHADALESPTYPIPDDQ